MKIPSWVLAILLGAALVWVGKTQFIPEEGWFVAPGVILIVAGLLILFFFDGEAKR